MPAAVAKWNLKGRKHMNRIEVAKQGMTWARTRTMALLDKLAETPESSAALGWRPGPGRAHIAWQLMHVAVTEELFATERLVPGSMPRNPELAARFRGGSTPDDEIPSAAMIRQELETSRQRLFETLSQFDESQLSWISPALAQRGLSLDAVLHLLIWHESHHQGQAHLTNNLFVASRGGA